VGVRGAPDRNRDAHLLHSNLDIDVLVSEEPPLGSTEKPAELYGIIERFWNGRRASQENRPVHLVPSRFHAVAAARDVVFVAGARAAGRPGEAAAWGRPCREGSPRPLPVACGRPIRKAWRVRAPAARPAAAGRHDLYAHTPRSHSVAPTARPAGPTRPCATPADPPPSPCAMLQAAAGAVWRGPQRA
jgi:hypothetical protein